jgi:hypothetical protein
VLIDPGSSGNQGRNQSSTFAVLVTSGNVAGEAFLCDRARLDIPKTWLETNIVDW